MMVNLPVQANLVVLATYTPGHTETAATELPGPANGA